MSIWGDDINLIYSNPALLNPSMSKQAAFNYCNYVGDLNFGYLGYAQDLKKYGTEWRKQQENTVYQLSPGKHRGLIRRRDWRR